MKKTFIAFVAGCAFTLLALMVAENMTYTTNTLRFCAICDAGIIAALCIGIVWDRMELTAMANAESPEPAQETAPVELPQIFGKHVRPDMDEVPPIPEEIEVDNESIWRAE